MLQPLETMRQVTSLLIFLTLFSASFETIQNSPIVTVNEGQLRGSVQNLLDGSQYYSFKGVPYAEPPVGDLRFKAPVPIKPWQGIKDALEHGSVCTQFAPFLGQNVGEENCLFLNIYTKSLDKKSKIPVMVYIHGGSYSSGSGDSDTYTPDFMLQHDVIQVTINYRLEVLGFLCLDTPEVPGNAGIKDQSAALRWIKNNIAKFGGDPDNITIFGESSGGVSVTYHMISPMSKGLFTKVIAQSGVCIQDWASGMTPKERAFKVGMFLGKETDDVNELLQFLRNVPAFNLTQMNERVGTADEQYRGLPEYFHPVVEKKFTKNNVEAFITEEPLNLLLSNKINKVNLMVGYNSAEGLIMLQDQLQKASVLNRKPSYYVPKEIVDKVSQKKIKGFGKRIKEFYFGDKDLSNDTAVSIVNLQTDVHFAYNTHRFAQIYSAAKMPQFMYRFDYDTDLNAIKIDLGYRDYKGACHADDLFYLFYNGFSKGPYEKQERLRDIVFRLTKLWTNFAKTGNPTPDNSLGIKWLPYTKSGKEFMVLNDPYLTGNYAERDRMEFWNALHCEAGVPCYKGCH